MFLISLLRKSFIMGAISIFALFTFVFSATTPYVIECNFDNTTPNLILGNLSYYESLPFDGNVLKTSAIYTAFSTSSVSYNTVYNEISPLSGKYTKLNHCWIMISLANPGDWFADWSTCTQNFVNLARVCKDLGLEGIMFDPSGGFDIFDPTKQASYPGKTEADYKAQAQLRGKEIMQACIKVNPAFKVLFLLGPYISEPAVPKTVARDQYPTNSAQFKLTGSFFVGFLQGSTTPRSVIDGGEIYQYRVLKDFQDSYTWRKYTIASDAINSTNIPVADRATYPSKVSISFGVYPVTWPTPADAMTPTIMRTATECALKTADDYVWWYGAITADYMTALKGAMDALRAGIDITSTDNVSVPTGDNLSYKITYVNNTGSTATLNVIKKPSWVTVNLDVVTGKAPTTIGTDSLLVAVVAGGKSDTLNLKITVATYLSFEAEKCVLTAPFQLTPDAKASGGQCISTPLGTTKNILTTGAPRATYSVNVAMAGSYYVWALISSITGANDVGTFTGLNGKYDKYGLKTVAAGAYEWVKSPTAYTLTAGANVFNMIHGNEQARIDKIVLTNSPSTLLPAVIPAAIEEKKISINKSVLNILVNKSINSLDLLVSLENNGNYNIKILNLSGQNIWEHNGIGTKGKNILKSSLKIKSGLYFVSLMQNNNKLVKKLMFIK